MLINTFVFVCRYYCNSLFSCFVHLQLKQNTASLIITKTNHWSPSYPNFCPSFNWLPIILIIFNAQHDLAPGYMTRLLTPYVPNCNLGSSYFPGNVFRGQGWWPMATVPRSSALQFPAWTHMLFLNHCWIYFFIFLLENLIQCLTYLICCCFISICSYL